MAQELQPHKVTKPIQLLAAWLLGLVLIDSAFLGAARMVVAPVWVPGLLAIAAVLNVPLFLVCIFLLQTRFRPEMQEDSFYSKYLEIQQETRTIQLPSSQTTELRETILAFQSRVTEGLTALDESITELRNRSSQIGSRASADVEAVLLKSEKMLESVREEVLWGGIDVKVNDYLAGYEEISRRLGNAGIPINGTFGSTSDPPKPPAYPVITFGEKVEPAAIAKIIRLLKDIDNWYITTSFSSVTGRNIYIGAYGYGGRPVSNVTEGLLTELSKPNVSFVSLNEWILHHPVVLKTDYPKKPIE